MAIIDLLNTKKTYDTQSVGGGVANGTTVSAVESVSSGLHKTVLTLANVVVPIVSVTTGAGVGGFKLYDMPQGWVKFLGATADLSMSVAVGKQADFTDNAPEGDLGIGTVAPANADALGTDATDDDICTASPFTGVAWTDTSITLGSEADMLIDGTTTAIDVYLNGLVDAGDIDDGVTTEILVSGTVTMFWMNLGDY